MANVFETLISTGIGTSVTNVGQTAGTAGSTGVVAASKQETIIGMTLANVTGGAINVDVQYYNGSTTSYLIKNAPIPSGSSLVPIGGDQKIVLTVGDAIRVTSDTAASVDVTMSILRQDI
tara:strand:+ start:188 stop:547 length:360 start_codon:yes stop_codon:yes gene_type:complete